MEQKSENEYNRLRIIYHEIIRGYTFDLDSGLYIRHFSESDVAETLLHKEALKKEYAKAGLSTKEERLKQAIEDGEWSKEKDEKVLELEYLISDNEKFLPTIVLDSQRAEVEKTLKEKKVDLAMLRLERAKAIGYNSDDLAEKESVNMFVKSNVYKDEALKIPVVVKDSDLKDMEEQELEVYTNALNKYLDSIRERDIRSIACLPFFLNRFSPCRERPEVFFNKSMTELTNHQLSLILSGARNITVLVEAEAEPPTLMDDVTIDALINWYDQQYSQILSKREGKSTGITKSEKTVVNRA